MIRSITERTGAEVNVDDSGEVCVSSMDEKSVREAVKFIESLIAEVEVGKVYKGTVKKITDFGAFLEILPGREGLVHISQLAAHRVNRVEDEVKVGDELEVKVLEVDRQGRIDLSRKALLPGGSVDQSPRRRYEKSQSPHPKGRRY